jgi:hypothetical protein
MCVGHAFGLANRASLERWRACAIFAAFFLSFKKKVEQGRKGKKGRARKHQG